MECGAMNTCLCLLKFIEYFPDYLSALSRTLLRFFGQPLSKQLYTVCTSEREQWDLNISANCNISHIAVGIRNNIMRRDKNLQAIGGEHQENISFQKYHF